MKSSRRLVTVLVVAIAFYCVVFMETAHARAAPDTSPPVTNADQVYDDSGQTTSVTSVTYSVYSFPPKLQQMQSTSLTPPSNLKIISKSSDSITLKWKVPSVTASVYGYHIYNGTDLVGTASAYDSTIVIGNLAGNTLHAFVVKTIDEFGNESVPSNKVLTMLSGSLRYHYDAAGRLQTITIQETGQVVQTYLHDSNGNLITVVVP